LADARRRQQEVLFEISEQKLVRAVESERQLQEVLVDFWFNHFNVFAGKGQVRSMLTSYERDTIRPHVFGKFRDLLGASAQAPAMLFYLDNWQSADPKMAERLDNVRRSQVVPRRPRGLNENYARELLELHTLGVDGGYTQKDVQEVARAFTGWTIDRPAQGGGFRFEPRMHDNDDKVVLGHPIKAGGGMRDGEQVLDILARHPSTAKFIATKLARRFISDSPPTSLVDRAADAFRRTDGDLREVVRTIITSPEFFAAEAYRAKVKTPFEFVTSALRTTGAQVTNGRPVLQALREMGMPLYGCQPPTGYSDNADAWVNTGALLHRMNFALALAGHRLRGTSVNLERTLGAGSAPNAEPLVQQILMGDVSDSTRATLKKSTEIGQMAALALGAPEFQKK
ncbi:MAG: DUF1800 domain-containing protein, partial [Acidobacteria bacterium]|nr:DUF1800 domain-containing protein [Acidobacteriota bacterium]